MRPALLARPAPSTRWWKPGRWPRWLQLLVGGAAAWGLAVAVLLSTGDRYVAGAVVLGTFVVPLALGVRVADGEVLPGVGTPLMVRLFAYGGLLGFLASAFLEHPMISQPAFVFDGWVGVVEEASKLAVLAYLTRHLVERTARSGLVLGGLVGLGFTAFESAGYATASAINSWGSSHAIIEMVVARALAAPFTHGLWTAVAGAALFASSRRGRYRAAPAALAALAGVTALHAWWDLAPNVAARLGGGDLAVYLVQATLSVPPLYAAYRIERCRGGADDGEADRPAGVMQPDGVLDRSGR